MLLAVKQKICRVMTLEYLRFSAVKLLLTYGSDCKADPGDLMPLETQEHSNCI